VPALSLVHSSALRWPVPPVVYDKPVVYAPRPPGYATGDAAAEVTAARYGCVYRLRLSKPAERVRCAVYTWVSTEYGLDQEFGASPRLAQGRPPRSSGSQRCYLTSDNFHYDLLKFGLS
jgi:hypothetical protein